jgi:hypothetical protein
MRIAGVMASQPMPESVRGQVHQGVVAEKRVVLRLRPYETFETPPRHVSRPRISRASRIVLANACHGNDRRYADDAGIHLGPQ